MLRLHFLLAWLLLTALPLQGYAAASMLFCGQVAPSTHAASPHDHSAHHHASDPADATTPHGGQDGAHTCSICAACCHGAAITGTWQQPAAEPVPLWVGAEPTVRIQLRPATVPDKPPRA